MNLLKGYFIIFKGLSLKQLKQDFYEGENPTDVKLVRNYTL